MDQLKKDVLISKIKQNYIKIKLSLHSLHRFAIISHLLLSSMFFISFFLPPKKILKISLKSQPYVVNVYTRDLDQISLQVPPMGQE